MNEINVLMSLMSILFLLILIFWLYRHYRVDKFRQQLFELRDNLFDEVMSGKINFNDPAYGMLRDAMNGFIRFGHRINIWQVILFVIQNNKTSNNVEGAFIKELNKSTVNYTATQKKIIDTYFIKMNIIILNHIVLSSPVLLLTIIIPALFFYTARLHIDRLLRRFSGVLDKLDSAALVTSRM